MIQNESCKDDSIILDIKQSIELNKDLLMIRSYEIFRTAVSYNRYSLTDFLLNNGCSPSVYSNAAMHDACAQGHLELMCLLVKHGGQLDDECLSSLKIYKLEMKTVV